MSGPLTPSSRLTAMEKDTGEKWTVVIKDFEEKDDEFTVYNIVSRSGRNVAKAPA